MPCFGLIPHPRSPTDCVQDEGTEGDTNTNDGRRATVDGKSVHFSFISFHLQREQKGDINKYIKILFSLSRVSN
jgi:hypothetical protein